MENFGRLVIFTLHIILVCEFFFFTFVDVYQLLLLLFLFSEATLGFDPAEYSVNENATAIEFSFGVLNGELGFSVDLQFFTSDGNTTCKPEKDCINMMVVTLK